MGNDKRLYFQKQAKEREGLEKVNNVGDKMKIIKYNSSKSIIVQFENKNYVTETDWSNWVRSSIKNPYSPSVFKKGYIGEGGNKSREENGEKTKKYLTWFAMLQRCYSLNSLDSKPTYLGCSVCEGWMNFQNFCEWFDLNYYEIPNTTMCLDKDILNKGNKIYSPNTCVFVPQEINKLLTKRDRFRGDLPIGVKKTPSNNFTSVCNLNNKNIFLGKFDNIKDAFNEYKKFKEEVMRIMADKYKTYIPKNLYDSLYSYSVEISD